MSHRVRTHKWIDGVLSFKDILFDSFDDAVTFAKTKSGHHVKIYDNESQLVHEETITENSDNTYA